MNSLGLGLRLGGLSLVQASPEVILDASTHGWSTPQK